MPLHRLKRGRTTHDDSGRYIRHISSAANLSTCGPLTSGSGRTSGLCGTSRKDRFNPLRQYAPRTFNRAGRCSRPRLRRPGDRRLRPDIFRSRSPPPPWESLECVPSEKRAERGVVPSGTGGGSRTAPGQRFGHTSCARSQPTVLQANKKQNMHPVGRQL